MSYHTNLVRAKFIGIANAVEELKHAPLSIVTVIERLDFILLLTEEGLQRLKQEEESK